MIEALSFFPLSIHSGFKGLGFRVSDLGFRSLGLRVSEFRV